MIVLPLEQEDQSSILERNGLLSTNKESKQLKELEEAINKTTSDLPIGKAIHLLLNVHARVFDKAIESLAESTPNEQILLMADSPTVRAILSLEHYLKPESTHELFRHLYNPLKEKVLKKVPNEASLKIISFFLLNSSYKNQIQQFFVQELSMSDKRSQLATILTLQFIDKNNLYRENSGCFTKLFIPSLAKISHATVPTVLACLALEVGIQFCRHSLQHKPQIEKSKSKIMEINVLDDVYHSIEPLWKTISLLLCNLEMWHQKKSNLEIEAYKELHEYLNETKKFNTKNITSAWDFTLSWLLPKNVLSSKPLSLKKQNEIIESTTIPNNVKIILLSLLQKNNWIEYYAQEKTLVSSVDLDMRSSVTDLYRKMDPSSPGKNLIPIIAIDLPYLCSIDHIKDMPSIQKILDQTRDDSEQMLERLTPLVLNCPEPSLCLLLFHVVQQDDQSKFSFNFLSYLISQNIDQVISILVKNILTQVTSSNHSCELLIKCMPYTDLTLLIQKLMQLVLKEKDDERKRMTFVALISKALLEIKWIGYGILVYMDLIRNFKNEKGIKLNKSLIDNNELKALTPKSITSFHSFEPIHSLIDEETIQFVFPFFLGSIQLWGTKIDKASFEVASRQLVNYTYSIPEDITCIDAWKNLSFAFLNDHSMIWSVIEPCLNIMKSQTTLKEELLGDKPTAIFETKQKIIFKRLNPMLILQTIPKDSYSIVQLPQSYINLKSNKLKSIGIDAKEVKAGVCNDKYMRLSVELIEELLQRSLEPKALTGGLQNPVEFSISLLSKIFCL